jgi:hypothetical protein
MQLWNHWLVVGDDNFAVADPHECFATLFNLPFRLQGQKTMKMQQSRQGLYSACRNGKKLYGQKAIHWLPLYMAVFLQRHKVACLKRYISCFFTRTSCELNCMSKGFSCNFLDLAVRQSPQGLSCDIFDKCSQPEYAGIEMIRMPHVHSSMSITVKLGVINSQFYSLSRLCFCMRFFVFEMLSLIVLLKIKCYPLKFLLKRTRALLNKENFLLGTSAFGFFRMILFRV